MAKSLSSAGLRLVLLGVLVAVEAIQAGTVHVAPDGASEFASIGAAVKAAASGDTIVLAPGTYTGEGNRDVRIVGKSLTIRSTDPNDTHVMTTTVIDCRGNPLDPHYAFEVDAGSHLTLEGIRIVNGYGSVSGGAIRCERGRLDVYRCVFANCRTVWWGGAVQCTDAEATFSRCTFARNESTEMHGGAISAQRSDIDLSQCVFESNRGGAVQTYDSSVTMDRCTFQDNTGGDGAAVYSHMGADLSEPTQVQATRCTFVNNTSEASGGALYVHNSDTTVESCTFSSNAAGQDGGALYAHRCRPFVRNCVFTGNVAADLGGAAMTWYDSGLDVFNCTFADNDAGGGGAIAGERNSDVLISHSILWNNTALRGPALYLARHEWGSLHPSTATIEYSDVAGAEAGVYVEAGCTLYWGSGNIDADPIFAGPLQNDYHLSPGSPCVNVGDPAYRPSQGVTDLDGNLRRFGETVDMGAYEFQGLGPVYRFRSTRTDAHFFTANGAERDRLLQEFGHAWTYDEVAWYTYYGRANNDLQPVFRFWSPASGAHFWTIDPDERDKIANNHRDVYTYEGPVFHAYPPGRQPLGTRPVYRFWSADLQQHFFTIDEQEKANLMEESASLWVYEGIAWYAYERFCEPRPTSTYAFTGGADQAWYVLTLAATVDGRDVTLDGAEVELTPTTTQMQMEIDFDGPALTLESLHIEAEAVERVGTILPAGGPAISFALSIDGTFDLPTRRGPYGIDPNTGVFADFAGLPQRSSTDNAARFSYTGALTIDERTYEFDRQARATQFELEAFGKLESMGLLPDAVYARVPRTFQWHRQYVKDLLAETSVNGRLVQIYVVYAYVATEGLWQGNAVD